MPGALCPVPGALCPVHCALCPVPYALWVSAGVLDGGSTELLGVDSLTPVAGAAFSFRYSSTTPRLPACGLWL